MYKYIVHPLIELWNWFKYVVLTQNGNGSSLKKKYFTWISFLLLLFFPRYLNWSLQKTIFIISSWVDFGVSTLFGNRVDFRPRSLQRLRCLGIYLLHLFQAVQILNNIKTYQKRTKVVIIQFSLRNGFSGYMTQWTRSSLIPRVMQTEALMLAYCR